MTLLNVLGLKRTRRADSVHAAVFAASDESGSAPEVVRTDLLGGAEGRVSASSPTGPATFGNLAPEDGVKTKHRFKLVNEGGTWYKEIPGKAGSRMKAKGWFDFVIQGNDVWGQDSHGPKPRPAQTLDDPPPGRPPLKGKFGHVDAAQGKRIEYGGQVKFSKGGEITEWNNGSGHFRPAREFAAKAGLPMDKFKPVPFAKPSIVQLPVFQGERRPPGTGGSGGDGGGGKGTAPTGEKPGAVPKVDPSKVEALAIEASALLKKSKAPKVEVKTIEQQSLRLEAESEALARQFKAHPEFKEFSGLRTKEFFAGVRAKYGSVRGGAANLIVLALNVAAAYDLLKEVGSILQSKTLEEGLQRSYALTKALVKAQVEFGILRFVVGSTPWAIGIQVFLGDMDMNLALGPNGRFDLEIAALVNKVRPGSVQPAFHHDNVTNFKDGDAKKLFMDLRADAIDALKGQIASALEEAGIKDGSVGQKQKAKFEMSAIETDVLRIDRPWLAAQYGGGYARGAAKVKETVARVWQEGEKDGKAGKAPRFDALLSWPEIQPALNGGTALEAYSQAYKAAYTKARDGFDTRTVTAFKISALGAEAKAEKYGELSLVANVEYSNGSSAVFSEEVEWRTDASSVATVSFDKGAKVARAHLLGTGKVAISGRIRSDGKVWEDSMTLAVKPPKIAIKPALSGDYGVGLEIQLTAAIATWPVVPASAIVWKATPPGIASVDDHGLVRMLKPGRVEVSVTEKTKVKPVRASIKFRVVNPK